ncbi:TetR family transcriptional regulator [Streptomyces sp. NPDC101151]|uniref:TetR family transcriptional regulator n=1 Tax=Streptomyces sp. NPDC101151 TaxID=3366115 RepID=UPI00380F8A23
MTQARAARTRESLILAAAAEIDRNGYRGATVTGICAAAGLSLGALTFHFGSKLQLALAVSESGAEAARQRAACAAVDRGTALSAVTSLARGLAELLESDVVVRSAARLERERPAPVGAWSHSWTPVLRCLLERAEGGGELRPGAAPQLVTTLVEYLLTGVEAHGGRAGCGGGVVSRLERIWPLVERGVAAERASAGSE